MKKQLGVASIVCLFLMIAPVNAQQVDVAFAGGTLMSPGMSFNSLGLVASEHGGTYVGFSGDALIKGHLGVQGEVNWRASQGVYAGTFPYRPLFWDFNAIYARRFSPHVGAEVLGGIGGTSIRFYQGAYNCDFYGNCTNYQSSNHFMADVGAGIRLYVYHNFFVRPEARLYMIHNNVEFSSGFPVRVGASVGYTFGGGGSQ
jgi:hypothetical protein